VKTKMFRVARIHDAARVPKRANPGDAGLDLSAVVSAVVPARGKAIVDTGIAISMPADCYARIAPRSGLAAKHSIDTFAGVVDSGYRDSLRVILFNNSDIDFQVNVGDRIAQLIFERIYTPDLHEVDYATLTEEKSERGTGGFGSSGV